ncbi:MAG TPA: hypothetical protein DE060_02450 [Lentisphaeria bacterium]|nr:hypothetical protein [Lentisphaeria bacterium]HCG48051.1 hypothetical protein [Lentisphaeria bacterium]
MKKIFLLFGMLAAVFLSACTTIPKEDTTIPAAPADCSAGVRLGDRLLTSIQANDFKEFHACLANGPASKLTVKDFKTSRESTLSQFGELKNFHFLTNLTTPAVQNLIWRVTFERKGSDGKMIAQDLLFRLVAGTVDEQPTVLSFGFL